MKQIVADHTPALRMAEPENILIAIAKGPKLRRQFKQKMPHRRQRLLVPRLIVHPLIALKKLNGRIQKQEINIRELQLLMKLLIGLKAIALSVKDDAEHSVADRKSRSTLAKLSVKKFCSKCFHVETKITLVSRSCRRYLKQKINIPRPSRHLTVS